ncbi:tape measure protein [Arthrobacter phage Moloch]|uniref:Tape measure protein n=1 Tax=Arthrobacter phage Moloch TaxID=1772308 RepID=A0A0U4IMV4_9CAUD|nr:tape measure protein [Arthrobacter phage Moloch]
MSRTAVLAVRIVTETKEANKGIDDTVSKLDKFERGLDKAALPAAAAGTAVLAFAKKTGDMASIAQQNAGAVDSVFKGNAKTVNEFAATAADKLGLSGSAYQQMASVIGSQLKNMGVPMDQVAGSTNDLIAKGADLAAMFGGTTSDAVDALSSLLRGERDPIEKYGVSINDAAIQAKKAELGLAGLSGEADKNATLTATMALLQKQTADATGQFAREADSAAGAQERANAKIQDAGAKLGSVFLPAMAAAATAAGGMATWASENSTVLLVLAGIIGGVAGAILLINGALKAWRAATAAVAAVQVVLNAVMSANPIGLVVLAIAALVAGLVWAYNNVGWFKDFVDQAFAAIGAVVAAVAQWFQDAWNNAVTFVQAYIEAWSIIINAVFTGIQTAVGAVAQFFTDAWNNAVTFVQAYISAWGIIINAVFTGVQSAVGAVADFFRNAWAVAVAIVAGVIRSWQAGVNAVFNAVGSFISGVVNNVRNVFSSVFNVILGIVTGVIAGVRGAIDGVTSTVQSVASIINGALVAAFNFVASAGRNAFAGITGAIQGVIGWIQNALSWVRNLASGIGNAVGQMLGLGGATAATVDAPGLSYFGGGDPGFEGGATSIFGGNTFFGAPAPKAAAPIIVNLTVNGAMDPTAVGKQIYDILLKYLRRNGDVVNGATPW